MPFGSSVLTLSIFIPPLPPVTPTLIGRRGQGKPGILERSREVHARGDLQGVETIHDEILNEEHQVTEGVARIREGTLLQEEQVAVEKLVALAVGEVFQQHLQGRGE